MKLPDICPLCATTISSKMTGIEDHLKACKSGKGHGECFWGTEEKNKEFISIKNINNVIIFDYVPNYINIVSIDGSSRLIPMIHLDFNDASAVQKFLSDLPKYLLL